MRGNCGGPFQEGLPYSQIDDEGRYVMGYRIAPDCDGDTYGDTKIRQCPVALANLSAPIVDAWNKHKSGLFSLDTTYPNPSIALCDAISYYDSMHSIYESRKQKQRMEEMKNGNSQ